MLELPIIWVRHSDLIGDPEIFLVLDVVLPVYLEISKFSSTELVVSMPNIDTLGVTFASDTEGKLQFKIDCPAISGGPRRGVS